jgi:ATP adenylyltransferase
MHYLWTPWRMQYISGAGGGTPGSKAHEQNRSLPPEALEADLPQIQPQVESTGCVFCDRIRLPESQDRVNLILLRAAHNFVILNLYPYNSAHLMVVPYEHTADFAGLDADTLGEMMSLLQRMVRVVQAEYRPEGFNMGMNLGRVAGAGVADHLHMHLVPRWAGDTNFMPIVGATKVMPELLETTYDRLKARLELV